MSIQEPFGLILGLVISRSGSNCIQVFETPDSFWGFWGCNLRVQSGFRALPLSETCVP